MISPIRRAAVSIAANVAEGAGRDSDPDLLRFTRIALGSLNEVETLVAIAADLGLFTESELSTFNQTARDLGGKLRNFAAKLKADVVASKGDRTRPSVREAARFYENPTAEFYELPQSQAGQLQSNAEPL